MSGISSRGSIKNSKVKAKIKIFDVGESAGKVK